MIQNFPGMHWVIPSPCPCKTSATEACHLDAGAPYKAHQGAWATDHSDFSHVARRLCIVGQCTSRDVWAVAFGDGLTRKGLSRQYDDRDAWSMQEPFCRLLIHLGYISIMKADTNAGYRIISYIMQSLQRQTVWWVLPHCLPASICMFQLDFWPRLITLLGLWGIS